MKKMPCVLSIAGSDCSGGAGIQADLKTMAAHGVYGMAVITAVTAQNTLGVARVMPVPPQMLEEQLRCVLDDIFPDAVKIGMLTDADAVRTVAGVLRAYSVKHVVIDPVMVSTSGVRLLEKEASKALITELFPLAEMITPNLPEAEALGRGFDTVQQEWNSFEAEKRIGYLAREIERKIPGREKPCILMKGGHLRDRADDYLWKDGRLVRYGAERIDNPNTHGTGCILSTAIACNLAGGLGAERSVKEAKEYLKGLLQKGLRIGHGNGPLI